MTPILYIPVGIPGSGKSTWAREMATQPEIISTDEIRKIQFGGLRVAHDPEAKASNNSRVFELFHGFIASHLASGRSVWADATNLTSSSRRTLRNIAKEQGAHSALLLFNNVEQAIVWNQQRDEDAIVPDDVMDSMVAKLLVTREVIKGEDYWATNVVDWID